MLALSLAGCGGEGISLPTVTRSDGTVVTPSISVPTRTGQPTTEAPEPTSEAPEPTSEAPEPTSEAPEPTSEAPEPTTEAPEPTTEAPEPTTEAPEPTTEAPEPTTEAPEPTTEASPEAAGADDTEDTGAPVWIWWLLALVVLGLLLFLLLRSRRRRAWDSEIATAEAETEWFARDLLPRLALATSPEMWTGGWQVSADRVLAIEDQLTRLETSAPDDVRRSRAQALRDAVRSARRGVEQAVVTPGASAEDLRFLAARLDSALGGGGPAPTSAPGQG